MISPLAEALRAHAHAHGLYPDEAAYEPLIHSPWLHSDDFARYVRPGTNLTDGSRLASIDWTAVAIGLDAGHLPCSSGEQSILRISASLAGAAPVDLRDCLTGLDHHTIQLVLTAVPHACGQPPRTPTLDHL